MPILLSMTTFTPFVHDILLALWSMHRFKITIIAISLIFRCRCTEAYNIGRYLVLCPKLTLMQPTWSAYPYHLVFLIWYPYALTSLYGNTAHCSGYGVAMGCYGLFIVTRTAIVTSQWYDRYCFTEYARMWARHPTIPWQRECTAITDRQSIDSSLDSMRFVTHFWEITRYILRDAIVVLVQSQCYSINGRAFGPRTPCRVGGLAGDVMRAWVSHSLLNHLIYNFKASLLSC